MSLPLVELLNCVGCYLIGGIPFGYLAGRLKGIDIRDAGSGNIGATNVGRLLGRRWGIGVFVLDVAKGLLPTLLVGYLLDSGTWDLQLTAPIQNLLWLGSGICCVLGHNYPIYLRFRGGKGVATSLGVVLGIYPYLTVAGGLAFAVWVIVVLATRYVSLGSVVAATSLPFLLAGCTLWVDWDTFTGSLPLLGFSALASIMVIYRHRGNLVRLRMGTESKIGSGSP